MKLNPQTNQIRGRGSAENPPNRFERLALEWEPEEAAGRTVQTQFFRDPSRSIVSRNDSPDVGFEVSVNPYRGCEHGCAYCYARPTHEYLSFSAGLDFETKILVKENAANLLRKELASPSWVPRPLALSGVTDPYQPIERKLGITRQCLTALAEFRNPAILVTKNHLVSRDADILAGMAEWNGTAVSVSLTTLDDSLQRRLEPRASAPYRRLAAIEALAGAGVPVRVMVAPVIAGLTDHEIPALLKAAACAGATSAGFILLRLPHGVKELFGAWLDRNFPEKKNRVLNRVRETRSGGLNDPRFYTRMKGVGVYAEQIRELFHVAARKSRLDLKPPELDCSRFNRQAATGQLGLFK